MTLIFIAFLKCSKRSYQLKSENFKYSFYISMDHLNGFLYRGTRSEEGVACCEVFSEGLPVLREVSKNPLLW